MPGPKRHPIYSKDATVYLETGADKFAALQRAIDAAEFLANVETAWAASGKGRADFLIALKPNLMTAAVREEDSPVYTDPALVEHLIARLREHGFTNIALVESPNVYNYAFQGRTVERVADLVGYRADGYRIVDLAEEPEPFDYGGVLGHHVVGRTWRDADYRISFAKNKTHWQCYYTACLKNVYGCLPEWDKLQHYHGRRREFFECCILILDAFPVHFGLLDAWVSGDGLSGHVRDADPNPTRTIFASANLFALDWVAGEKMGLDPTCNAVIREALKRWVAPVIERKGDLTPWPSWANVRPFTVWALDQIEEFYGPSRFLSRAFASQQDERFPPLPAGQWLFGRLQRFSRWVEPFLIRNF